MTLKSFSESLITPRAVFQIGLVGSIIDILAPTPPRRVILVVAEVFDLAYVRSCPALPVEAAKSEPVVGINSTLDEVQALKTFD